MPRRCLLLHAQIMVAGNGSSEKPTCQVLVIDTLAKLSHDADQENSYPWNAMAVFVDQP